MNRIRADIRSALKEVLGNEFPSTRKQAEPFVLAIKEALRLYDLAEAMRLSENDSMTAKQLVRALKCATQLIELLQPYDSVGCYSWINANGVRVERPALNALPRILDMYARSKQGDLAPFSTATIRENLVQLVATGTDVLHGLETEWRGICRPKRGRGVRRGRRAAQIQLAVRLATALRNAGVEPRPPKERLKGALANPYARLVKWALAWSPHRTKKRGEQTGDGAAVARQGFANFQEILNRSDH